MNYTFKIIDSQCIIIRGFFYPTRRLIHRFSTIVTGSSSIFTYTSRTYFMKTDRFCNPPRPARPPSNIRFFSRSAVSAALGGRESSRDSKRDVNLSYGIMKMFRRDHVAACREPLPSCLHLSLSLSLCLSARECTRLPNGKRGQGEKRANQETAWKEKTLRGR